MNHGLSSVEGGGPLIPFVMAEENGELALNRFMSDTLEAGMDAARKAVEQDSELSRYAIAYDGYVTKGGERMDAIYVEAGERGSEHSLFFFHRYRPKKGLKRFKAVGDMEYSGYGDNRLT